MLMGKLENRIGDRRLLRIIRRYLEAGVMVNGVAMERHEGTPQGGPLSPLLANVLLDEVHKEPERRGHAFACGSTKTRARWRGCGTASSWATASGRRNYGHTCLAGSSTVGLA